VDWEPTYQSYKSTSVSIGGAQGSVDYKSVQVNMGLRYYIYLNDKSKGFINTNYVFDFPFNSKIYSMSLNETFSQTLFFSGYRSIELIFGYNIF
jgi:hypothetical protein